MKVKQFIEDIENLDQELEIMIPACGLVFKDRKGYFTIGSNNSKVRISAELASERAHAYHHLLHERAKK